MRSKFFDVGVAASLLLAITAPAAADVKLPKLPPDLDLMPRDGLGFISIRVADLWKSEATAFLRDKDTMLGQMAVTLPVAEKMTGIKLTEVDRATLFFGNDNDPVMVVRCSRPIDRTRLCKSEVLGLDVPEKQLDGLPYFVKEPGRAAALFTDDSTLVYGTAQALQAFREARKKSNTGLHDAALQAAVSSQVAVAFQFPPGILPTFGKALQADIPGARSWDIDPLLAARSILVTMDFQADARARLALAFPNALAAAAAEKIIRRLHKEAVAALPDFREGLADSLPGSTLDGMMWAPTDTLFGAVGYLKTLEDGLKTAEIRRNSTTLFLSLHLGQSRGMGELLTMTMIMGPMFLPMQVTVRDMDGRDMPLEPQQDQYLLGASSEPLENLRRLTRAMLQYHDKHGHLPPAAACDKDGKALLSWRALLLPYLGADDLYKQFKLDEPWDSPHNKKLLPRMPPVFVSYHGPVDQPDKSVPTTRFQVFLGKGAGFEGTAGLKLTDFKDGPENTILIAEANVAVPWTKPADLPFRPEGELPALGFNAAMNAAFGDGRVCVIQGNPNPDGGAAHNPRARFDERLLRAFITRGGGKPIRAANPSGDRNPEVLYAVPGQPGYPSPQIHQNRPGEFPSSRLMPAPVGVGPPPR
jgi:hypothetical protein